MAVMIGVDPDRPPTAAVLDEHGQLLDQQHLPATLDGDQTLRGWAERWPQRGWRSKAPTASAGGWPSGWSATANRSWTCRPAGRPGAGAVGRPGPQSDPDDAVAVAVAARNAPWLRRVTVEDRATVLHLLTKRPQDLVAARTQPINRLHRLLVDLVPGGARRNLTAKRAAALLSAVAPTGARRSPAGSWPAT